MNLEYIFIRCNRAEAQRLEELLPYKIHEIGSPGTFDLVAILYLLQSHNEMRLFPYVPHVAMQVEHFTAKGEGVVLSFDIIMEEYKNASI